MTMKMAHSHWQLPSFWIPARKGGSSCRNWKCRSHRSYAFHLVTFLYYANQTQSVSHWHGSRNILVLSVGIPTKLQCTQFELFLRLSSWIPLFHFSWGESAGAISVGLHLVLNNGRPEGLFRGAFMVWVLSETLLIKKIMTFLSP